MVKTRPRRGSPLHLSGAFELFGQSYRTIRRNFEVFMVLFAINGLWALWDTLGRYVDDEPERDWKGFLFNWMFDSSWDSPLFSSGGFIFIVSVLAVIAYLLITIGVLRAAQGHRISLVGLWKELIERWLWLKLIAALLLVVLYVLAGFILFIIPGVILIWRLFFVQLILIDQKVGIKEAIKRSWNMTRGYGWPIYSVILVSVLLSLTTLTWIVGPILAFVLTSIYTVAPAIRYTEIKKLNG